MIGSVRRGANTRGALMKGGLSNPLASGSPVVRAMSLLVFAMTLIPMMDAFGKLLSTEEGVAPASVALARFSGQVVILGGAAVVLIALRRGASLRPQVLWVHLARGAFHGSASLLFFVALKYMPLADTIAVFFVEPMILLALSAVLLGEVIGWPRCIAAVVGFGGAVLVIQPSYELFGPVSLLPLATALLFALYLIFTRKFGVDEHPLTMQFWSGVGASLTALVFISIGELVNAGDYAFTVPSSSRAWLFVAGMASISATAHILIVLAFKLAEASVLAPFNYLEIVTATVFGYVVFDDFPGALQWLGISIIVGTGLFIFFRERQLEQRAAAAAT